ncbi:MAG: TIGR02186 family protein [Alphaproteobacteria bacterium]|nr:TIGR02186 family protein [Alphaproteobacteria bacterium]
MSIIFKLFLSILLFVGTSSVAKADLVTDLSERRIDINSTFTGASLLLFGTFTEAFDYDPKRHDIVITVKGPNKPMILRKKAKKGGIWINYFREEYMEIPSYYSVLSSRPLEDISDKPTLGKYGLGTSFLFFNPNLNRQRLPDEKAWLDFRNAAVRLKKEEKLYIDQPNGVKFVGNGLFRANVDFPANVDVGKYEVSAYLFRDGNMIFEEHSPITMSKFGFSNQLTQFAHNYPWTHGFAAVLFALFSGWLAAVVFKRK